MSHVDEITCMLYLDGQLDRGRAAELAHHLESCVQCVRLLEALEHEGVLLRTSLAEEDEPVPARFRVAPARQNPAAWGWIAALGLASAGMYTLWVQIIGPWRASMEVAGFGEQNLLSMLLFSGVFWGGWEEMMNMVQTLATGSLLLLGLMLFVRLRRRWTTFAVVMGSLAMLLGAPAPAQASEFIKKQSYTLAEGETKRGDLFVLSKTARINGTVEGDLFAFGESVVVNGTVKGDVISFAKSLRIAGQVDGNVRSFANVLSISGHVTRNVTVFAENLEFEDRATLDGSLTLFVKSGGIDGRLGRDLTAMGGMLRLAGTIGGDVRIHAERLTVDATAAVGGKFSYKGRHEADVSPQAKLASPIQFEQIVKRVRYTEGRFYWRQSLRWIASLLFGLVLMWLAPGLLRDAMRAGDNLGAALGWGGGLLFLLPIASFIACITLVGMAVGISGLLLWMIALYASQILAGAWLGGMLLKGSGGTGRLIGAMALGLLILRVAGHLPWVGGWILFLSCVWGLGLLGSAVYARLRPQPLAV